jgi:20S proteasome alpha/beta subunit
MTLCIGALAQIPSPHSQCIVLCFDSLRSGGDDFSSEGEYKFHTLSPQIVALYAGRITRAKELTTIYQHHLSTVELTLESLQDTLTAPLSIIKKRHANAYIQRKLAISYDDLLKNGEQWLGKELCGECVAAIAANELGVDMIFAGFVGGEPVLFELRNGEISETDHFSLIGSGAYTAEPAMHARAHTKNSTLSEALYNTFEAKKIGETSPFVGTQTTMVVIHPPNEGSHDHVRAQFVTKEGFKFLQKQFRKYGPKPIKTWTDIPKGTLETAYFNRDEGY